MLERPQFLERGAVPFALGACEKFTPLPVKGYYDEVGQVWRGDALERALTLTLTATPGDRDDDQD